MPTYLHPDIDPFVVRGPPLDICEQVFLYSLSGAGPCGASLGGDVVRLHVEYSDGEPKLFARTTSEGGARGMASLEREGRCEDELPVLLGPDYEFRDVLDGTAMTPAKRWRTSKPG